ncbi:MFS transporter [Streptomyces sp. NPDC014894]|uniref:MFS transporter n=1 Tax=Streptomyces sp. NPDC014894 TaxID=3364931 RepID=UPI0036F76EA2
MTTEPVVRPSSARATLWIACAAPLLVLVAFTAPVSTIRVLTEELGSGESGRTWILGSISVGLAASLMAAGTLADHFGRRRLLVLGGAGLALASAVCATASDTPVFVLGRLAQGAAGAALLASSLGLLGHAFPPGPRRARATGLWGAMVGGGIAIGPVYAAVLTEAAGRPSVYWVLAVLAAVVALWGALSLQESRSTVRRRFDPAGVLTLAAGISLLVAALTEGRSGWTRAPVVLSLAAGVLLLGCFALVERRAADPVLEPAFLRRPAFVASTTGALVTGVAVIGLMTYVPVAAQLVLGLSPLESAGLLAFWSGLSFLVAPQARRFVQRVGDRQQVAAGLLVCGVGMLALTGVTGESSWWRLVPGLVLAGVGSGVVNAALASLAVRSVPPDRVSVGSAANNTARYLGSSLGVAMVAAVVAAPSAGGGRAGAFSTGMSWAAVVCGALAIAGAVVVALCRERTAPTPEGTTPEGPGGDRAGGARPPAARRP